MSLRPLRGTARCALAAVAAGALAFALPAGAGWAMGAGGNGSAAAGTMPAGNTPAASATLTTVTVTWTASSFSGGGAVPGYVVTRINAVSGVPSPAGDACAGSVAGTSCTENPGTGQWKYAVTPAAGGWRGSESGASNTVTVVL